MIWMSRLVAAILRQPPLSSRNYWFRLTLPSTFCASSMPPTLHQPSGQLLVILELLCKWNFYDHHLALSAKESNEEVIAFDVEDMPAAGKAKVCHVGVWAIRKVLDKSRRYIRANMYSGNAQTMASARQHHSIREVCSRIACWISDDIRKWE